MENDEPRTKWSILQARLARLEADAKKIREELETVEKTSFGSICTGCGVLLNAEADFWRHFTIPDSRFLNIDYCPNPQGNR